MEIGPLNRVNPAPAVYASPVPQAEPVRAREIVTAVRALNQTEFLGKDHQMTFVSDPRTHQMVIRIVDRNTGAVIDQLPEEYVLRMAAELPQQKRRETK